MPSIPLRFFATACCAVAAPLLFAQTPGKKWELELHASGFLKDDAKTGTKALPPAGRSFSTIIPNADSRQVSSFLFGDGNALINQVLAGRGLNPILPLDRDILNNRKTLERQSNIGVGLRLSRYVSRKYWLDWTTEYDVDYDRGSFEVGETQEFQSFQSMKTWITSMESLFGRCGKPCRFALGARMLSTHEKGHSISSAFTINRDFRNDGRVIPYVGAGGALVVSFAGIPRQEYFAHYSLRNGTIQGSDHVLVDFKVPAVAPAAVVAVGAKFPLGKRWGLRGELRNYLESHSFSTLLQARPEFTDGGTGNVIALSGGGSTVQFSDNQALAPTSLSLRQPSFRTFKSSGLRYEGRLSGGVYYRF